MTSLYDCHFRFVHNGVAGDYNNNNNVYSDKRHMIQLKIWNNNIRFGQI